MKYFQKKIFFSLIFIMSTGFNPTIFCAHEPGVLRANRALAPSSKKKYKLLCPVETIEWQSHSPIPMGCYPTTPIAAQNCIASILEARQTKRKSAHNHLVNCLILATNLPKGLAEIVVNYIDDTKKTFLDFGIPQQNLIYKTFFTSIRSTSSCSGITIHPESNWNDINKSLKEHHVNELNWLRYYFPEVRKPRSFPSIQQASSLPVTHASQLKPILIFNNKVVQDMQTLIACIKAQNTISDDNKAPLLSVLFELTDPKHQLALLQTS